MGPGGVRWGAGIVNHGSFDDLERCLGSLEKQSIPPSEIVVYDTGEDEARIAGCASRWARVRFETGRNLGYAGGANRVIARLREARPPLDAALVLNPDVALDPNFAERLVEASVGREHVALATGKLLRPDRETIDSAGIFIPRNRRPQDRGSDEPDRGQYERVECVDAASGAALWIQLDCVAALSIEGELFDEGFFAYHEDTDLGWRARRFGFEVLYVPGAVATHARAWQKDRRGEIAPEIRRHSFKNHYLQIVKNELPGDLLRNAPWLIVWEVLRAGFVLVRERTLARGYLDAWEALPKAFRQRRLISERATAIRRLGAAPSPRASSEAPRDPGRSRCSPG